MESFFIALFTISTAELGDKTQILAFLFSSQYKKPYLVILAIFMGALLNHTLAASIGVWFSTSMNNRVIHLVLALSFGLATFWACMPDHHEDRAKTPKMYSSNILISMIIIFFIAEMGDKTQIATAILAAKFNSALIIVFGTTCGMLLANVPAVFLGSKAFHYIPIKNLKLLSALLFVILGCIELRKFFIY